MWECEEARGDGVKSRLVGRIPIFSHLFYTNVMRYLCFAFLVGMTGCSAIPAVTKQAAFDLNCPPGQVQVIELAGYHSYGATGCGRRASYMASCNLFGQCGVVANGAQGPMPAPTQAPSPAQ